MLDFDGKHLKDKLGGNNNAEAHGVTVIDDPDMGRSLKLEGGYIRIPYAEDVAIDHDFSVQITMKSDKIQFYGALLSNYKNDDDGLLVDIERSLRVIAPPDVPYFFSRTPIEPGKVYTVKLVVLPSAKKVQLYLNGILDTEYPISRPFATTGGDLFIGARNEACDFAYSTVISDIEILNLSKTVYPVAVDPDMANGSVTVESGHAAEPGSTV